MKIFDELRSDQRVAIFESGVTGKPRRIDLLRSLASREGQSILSITHDLKDEDIDIDTHPIMNLLDFKDAAREVIFEKTNGLHGFVLFNGKGELQDEVPPDVAIDNLIPVPHGGRLQPAISCIRCHGKEGGWKKLTNDVKTLLTNDKYNPLKFDILFDKDAEQYNNKNLYDRLAGLYAGNLERKILPRGRDDYANAISMATGYYKTDSVQYASDLVSKIYDNTNYKLVTQETVCHDLGIEKLNLPPVSIFEDPRIRALVKGLGIKRSDYDLVYSYIASRIKK